ncbi:MAG TPA: phosphatase domain-containing protein [Pyrinomonadaceae bacterium]|nr:phosphatase domain-containing protein [Pyrinomonadaceae bacterium]
MPNDFLKGIKDAAKGAIHKVEDVVDKVGDAVEKTVEDIFRRDKEVVVYTTYGYRKQGDPNTWVVRLRVWVNKARRAPIPNQFLAAFTSEMGHLGESDVARLRERISAFVADDDSGETVSVSFDKDPEERRYVLPRMTDFNGLIMDELELRDASAQAILAAQGSTNGWIDFTVTAEGFEGKGRARLVEPEGVSVISDIDDTIKITEVPAGKHIVLRNTFLRDYVPVEAMTGRYRAYPGDVMFHYVSGSPWQLHKLLGEFVGEHFPEGAFHMKDVRKNLLVPDSWKDFVNFSKGDEATLEQKKEQISRIIMAFPDRKFILYGDSGERDPDVFCFIKERFPEQDIELHIRDVVRESLDPKSKRLVCGDGTRIDVVNADTLDADTVTHGVTRFKD